MLKYRRKLLALILGMSMFLTFPVRAAEMDIPSAGVMQESGAAVVEPAPSSQEQGMQAGADNETEASGEMQPTEGAEILEVTDIIDKTEETETVIQDGMIVTPMDENIQEIELEPGQEKPEAETDADTEKADGEWKKLVIAPEELKESFRFETISKEYAVARKKVKILTAKSSTAEAAGKLARNGLCYILLTEEEWCYVESGNVRGFVKRENLITGEEARDCVFEKKLVNMKTAKAFLMPSENPAFTYTKTTVQETVVKRVPGIAGQDELNVREERSTEARIIGVIPKGGVCYILADGDSEWCYVESGDVRGFVKSELLTTGKEAKQLVKENGRQSMLLAEEKIAPEENKALYYTLTSTSKAYGRRGKYLGKFKLTAYCTCSICCGPYANGITASGMTPVQGRTIAMYGVPFGTKLIVGNEIYTVEDRGTPYGHIDIYMVNHEDAQAFGVKKADVYLAN